MSAGGNGLGGAGSDELNEAIANGTLQRDEIPGMSIQ